MSVERGAAEVCSCWSRAGVLRELLRRNALALATALHCVRACPDLWYRPRLEQASVPIASSITRNDGGCNGTGRPREAPLGLWTSLYQCSIAVLALTKLETNCHFCLARASLISGTPERAYHNSCGDATATGVEVPLDSRLEYLA